MRPARREGDLFPSSQQGDAELGPLSTSTSHPLWSERPAPARGHVLCSPRSEAPTAARGIWPLGSLPWPWWLAAVSDSVGISMRPSPKGSEICKESVFLLFASHFAGRRGRLASIMDQKRTSILLEGTSNIIHPATPALPCPAITLVHCVLATLTGNRSLTSQAGHFLLNKDLSNEFIKVL